MTNPERRRLIDRIKTIEERLIVVVNPMSKRGPEKASHVRSLIRREGMNLEETSTDHPDDVGQTMEFWSKRFGGSRIIMVFGGDGAINQVINNIMLSRSNKNVVLVPMPAGTANDFCRALEFDSVESALEAMVEFNIRSIDLLRVEVDGKLEQVKYCSNIFGVGLDGDLARRSQKYKKFGVPGYWYASLKVAARCIFRGMDMYRMRVQAGGIEHEGKTIGVMLSNIESYGQNLKIAPGARPDDGKIHVSLIKPMSGIKSLTAAIFLIWGWHTKFKQVNGATCEEADVELFDDAWAQEDGEVVFYPRGTKFHLSIERQVLNVLASSPVSPNGSGSA
ncbi:MAG: diacylglycerol/lipid kinase family protein [Candidatus Geothermincolia bacterium]